jgi:hypothetical protein
MMYVSCLPEQTSLLKVENSIYTEEKEFTVHVLLLSLLQQVSCVLQPDTLK